MHAKKRQPNPSSIFFNKVSVSTAITQTEEQLVEPEVIVPERAIVYCEGHFGEVGGQPTHDLLRHSDQYEIISVIDDENAGKDSGKVLNGEPNKIPVFRNLGTALAQAGRVPAHFIYGIDPESGVLADIERRQLLRAIGYGMNIACGLHESLNADPEFAEAAAKAGVVIQDI
ncbi:hypothetical protein NT6N_39010 [Oceaniferula spumae]|uniref:D-glutamate N-acetyltransferase-like N-terminal domain-containing protein n=1 Tax=Oceaniferula spumae TaxID=2979115 RepID=A0AAT9FS59_9BACT